ncbi:hypothetical protein LXA43DRAFT_1068590 [Ganoderma leucocontextum]|nr:hypothetical protein LXA43DRAFT_1068590 [Ganoderma leucocontextum]
MFHAPDEEDPSLPDRHISFKPGEVFKFGDDEYRIERKLRGRPTSMLWLATQTNKRYDDFGCIRPNVLIGPHICIVKEPCGPTLAALEETQPHHSFTLPVSKKILKQMLLALDFIHTTMKRTHVGVNPHNIQVADSLSSSSHQYSPFSSYGDGSILEIRLTTVQKI